MDQLDLSRRLRPRALRRLANRYRRQLIGGASLAAAAAATIVLAAPALAHDGLRTPTPLAACSATVPLTTPCSAAVTAPATTAGDYTVTLPGIGTLTITIDANSVVTGATVSGLTGFTASTPKVDKDGDRVTVTLTSTTDPNQVYKLKVAVKAPATAGGPATVTAKVKAVEKKDADEANEAAEFAKLLSQHKGVGIGEHHHFGFGGRGH